MTQTIEANPAIEAFLEKHQSINAMPESSIRIMRHMRDPDCDMNQLLRLIKQDAALSARIMKAVNSAFYALQTKITQLDRAVVFMGLKAVKEVVISSAMQALCNPVPIGKYSARDLWDHSVGVAVLSRELAVRSKTIDSEDAFLVGMLHDVGLLLAAQCEIDKSAKLFLAAEAKKFPFSMVEQKLFNFDHCELGTRLAEAWRFPEDVSAVIRWHHKPEQAPETIRRLCTHVFISDTLCTAAAIGFPLTCAMQEVTDERLAEVGLTRAMATEVTDKLKILVRLHMH